MHTRVGVEKLVVFCCGWSMFLLRDSVVLSTTATPRIATWSRKGGCSKVCAEGVNMVYTISSVHPSGVHSKHSLSPESVKVQVTGGLMLAAFQLPLQSRLKPKWDLLSALIKGSRCRVDDMKDMLWMYKSSMFCNDWYWLELPFCILRSKPFALAQIGGCRSFRKHVVCYRHCKRVKAECWLLDLCHIKALIAGTYNKTGCLLIS